MTLTEAKALLSTAKRGELRDHAFGDCELHWEIDGEEVASGYSGADGAQVWLGETCFIGDDARALRDLGAAGTVERNDSTGPADYREGVTMPTLTREGVLAELTTPPTCRACSECDGNHHFSESGLQIPENGLPYIDCKHCDAKAHVCETCDGPIFPITGAAVCRACAHDIGDFDDEPEVVW